jgi:hypothetical protein
LVAAVPEKLSYQKKVQKSIYTMENFHLHGDLILFDFKGGQSTGKTRECETDA